MGQCKDEMKKVLTISNQRSTKSQNHRMAEAPQWDHLVQHPCSSRVIPDSTAQDSTQTALKYLQRAGGVVHKITSEIHLLPSFLNIKEQEQPKTCIFFASKPPGVCPAGRTEIPQVQNDNSQPKILNVRIFFDSFTPSNGHESTKLIHLCSVNHNRN